MSISDRKEREKEDMKNLILNAAGNIITSEGMEKLSIRKIAGMIDYSPAIIYHYFKDKDDIINSLMIKGYGKIVGALKEVQALENDPEQRIKRAIRSYINLALTMPDEYKSILLSSSPNILEHTTTLFKGASKKRQALGMLYGCLEDILGNSCRDDEVLELTAQLIWTATFGLIIRLLIEKNTPEEQRNKLIEHHINIMIDRMILGKPLNNLLK